MNAEFFIKEVHKIYNFADSPAVERRVYWLFEEDRKRDLVVEVEIYTNARIYKFYIEDEKSSDHYLIENMKKIAEISSTKQLDEEKIIRRILNSKIGSSMKEQYLKEVDEELFVWIKSIEGLDLLDLKDDLV